MLSVASDNEKLLAEIFLENSNFDGLGSPVLVLSSRISLLELQNWLGSS